MLIRFYLPFEFCLLCVYYICLYTHTYTYIHLKFGHLVLENLHLILMLISLVMNEADVFFHITDFILKRRYLATLIHNWFESLTEPPSDSESERLQGPSTGAEARRRVPVLVLPLVLSVHLGAVKPGKSR